MTVRILPFLAVLLIGMVAALPAPRAASRPLRVMTYNLNYRNPDPGSALDAIARADVDVVLLQEVTSEWKRVLTERFGKQYPHSIYRIHTRAAGGLAVLSRAGDHGPRSCSRRRSAVVSRRAPRLETGFGALQILNVHLRPAIDGGSWIKGFMTTPPLRRREIESYWQKMVKDMPTIVAGDFNEDTSGTAISFLTKQGLSRVDTKGPTTWHYEVTSGGKTNDSSRWISIT